MEGARQRNNVSYVVGAYIIIAVLKSELMATILLAFTESIVKARASASLSIPEEAWLFIEQAIVKTVMSMLIGYHFVAQFLSALIANLDPTFLFCMCLYIGLNFEETIRLTFWNIVVYMRTKRVVLNNTTDIQVKRAERVYLKASNGYVPAYTWISEGITHYLKESDIQTNNSLFPAMTSKLENEAVLPDTKESKVSESDLGKATYGRVNVCDSTASGQCFRVGNHLMVPRHVYSHFSEKEQTLSKPGSTTGIKYPLASAKVLLKSDELDFVVLDVELSIWALLGVKSLTPAVAMTGALYNCTYEVNGETFISNSTLTLNPDNLMYEHSMNTLPGSSGTPIYDAKKQVVAMHVAYNPSIGRNMAVPIQFLLPSFLKLSNESDMGSNALLRTRYNKVVDDYIGTHDPNRKATLKATVRDHEDNYYTIRSSSGGVHVDYYDSVEANRRKVLDDAREFRNKSSNWADYELGPGKGSNFQKVEQSQTIKETTTGNPKTTSLLASASTPVEQDPLQAIEMHRRNEVLTLKQHVAKLENSLTTIGQELVQLQKKEVSSTKQPVSEAPKPPVKKDKQKSSSASSRSRKQARTQSPVSRSTSNAPSVTLVSTVDSKKPSKPTSSQ